jgi:hypothetical protein
MFPAVAGDMARHLLSWAGSLVVSWSARRARSISVRGLHLIMKHNIRYHQVVQPGIVSGVAFVTAYEVEDFHATASDDLPDITAVGAPSEPASAPWTRTMGRLSSAFRRWGSRTLRPKAAA